ncbi:uncharacterized protein N7458_004355 [Penicillium daleae]|uniref:Uncharacterized protein n=1 Tax=Penicillium daleae TaxID=63821 RepID=A0AAD6G3P9_9EURO|nr:uncharacterized protein N7458_004355 [Penicillium daleae]KAJ5453399.1 hypothetical protein N7458_004355 [Penicillium daleae]
MFNVCAIAASSAENGFCSDLAPNVTEKVFSFNFRYRGGCFSPNNLCKLAAQATSGWSPSRYCSSLSSFAQQSLTKMKIVAKGKDANTEP